MSMKKSSHKILKSVALAGALTATGAVATTAHADTAKASAPVQGVASTDQQLTNLKSQQTANESAVASSNAATMSAATTSASSQIADLNNKIKERQASDAAAQQASQARAIAQANSEAASATAAENASYSQAVASQTAANNVALKSAQATIVTEQQKNQETAQENTDFQKQIGDLQKSHNQTLTQLHHDNQSQSSQITDQIQKANDDIIKTHNKQVADATTKFNDRVENTTSLVSKAKDLIVNDNKLVNEKNKINVTAQKKLNDDTNKLMNEKEELNKLENHETDSIAVTSSFIDGWKDYTQIRNYDNETLYLPKKKYPKIWKEVHDACIQSKKLNGDFHANPDDEKVPITFDANGVLSRKDIIEATKYAVQLLNPLREKIGMTPLKITNASIDIATEVAKDYHDADWDTWKDGHDGKVLNNIAKEWGTDFVDEDLAGSSVFDDNSYTLADLKQMVYQSVLMLLFEGAEDNNDMGHTTSLLGVRADWASTDLIGVTYTRGTNSMHFNLIEDGNSQHVKNVRERGIVRAAGSSTDKTIHGDNYTEIKVPEVPDYSTLKAKVKEQIKTQQIIVDNDKNDVNTSQNNLNLAKTKLNQDNKDLLNKQSILAQLQTDRTKIINNFVNDPNNVKAIQVLQSHLEQLNKKLIGQKTAYNQAVTNENNIYQDKLRKIKESHDQKLVDIKAQPTSLAELQSQLQAKLDTLKANHDDKLKQITDDANAKIAAIKSQKVNDPEIDKLNAQIDQIKSDLAKKQQELDNQYEALKTKNQAEYNALANKLNPSTKAVANGSTQQVFTSRSGKVTYVVPSQQSLATKGVVKTVSEQNNSDSLSKEFQSQNNNRLPQTGNQSSLAMVLLGAAAAMFGVGLASKKKEY